MDSTAVCNMTQDYTPHFGPPSTPYSAVQGPPPLTPTDIFERPRNKRKSSYPSGLVNYPEPEMNNGNSKDYYMDIDDSSIDASTEADSPPSMASSVGETLSRPTYLGAPQDFSCKLSPSQDRSPMNGYHGLDEKFGGPSEPKYMRNGQDKYPMLSPTEQKYNGQEYAMNGHDKFMQNGRSESLEKFSDQDRYQMFSELTKVQYENGLKFQEKYAEKYVEMSYDARTYGDFSPDQQVPARSPGSAERPIKQEPSTPPPPLTSPAGLKIPYPPMLSDLSPNSFSNLSPNKFPEPLNGFAHDQPLDFSTKLKDEFYTTTQAPPPVPSPDDRNKADALSELNKDGTSNFTCKHCHRPFKSQVNLDRHVEKSHNPKSSKIFSCLLCPYTTRFYSNMYVHIRTHTGDKPYWCGACGASFSQGSSLKIHIISKHGGNKKFFILDRKLGKANLLRFWQRREASQLNADNENSFKPDLKKFNGFPGAFPGMMNMNGMAPEGPPPIPGLEKVDRSGPSPNGVQNPMMPNHLPMNNIGNLFPNGMNMFGPMNPLGLNLMGQNPLAGANPMLFGNNNLLLQQSLMNGLNLKNSAFFTKTTKFADEKEGKEKSPGSSQTPNFYNDMKEPPMKQNGGNPLAGLLQNGKLSPTKMRFPDFPPVSLPGGLPPFGPLPPLGGSLPVSLATTLSSSSLAASMMPMPPLMTSTGQCQPTQAQNNDQTQQQISPRSAAHSPQQREPTPESKPIVANANTPITSRASSEPNNGPSAGPQTAVATNGSQNTAPVGNTTPTTVTNTIVSAKPTELCERKLRDLRRNVVKMLRMMVPDLQMDKNMNQEGEDVDMLLKEVIWSTATEMEGAPDDRLL